MDDIGFSEEDGNLSIDASNRYFTLLTDKNKGEESLLTKDMDPNGYLKRAAGTAYIHTEENKVYYFKSSSDKGGLQ